MGMYANAKKTVDHLNRLLEAHDDDLRRILGGAPRVLELGDQALQRSVRLLDRLERLMELQEERLELEIARLRDEPSPPR